MVYARHSTVLRSLLVLAAAVCLGCSGGTDNEEPDTSVTNTSADLATTAPDVATTEDAMTSDGATTADDATDTTSDPDTGDTASAGDTATSIDATADTGGDATMGCEAPLLDCENTGTCSVDIDTNTAHCGACNLACESRDGATTACSSGTCEWTCDSGWLDCDMDDVNGCEVDETSDAMNCGACGNVCDAEANAVSTGCQAGGCTQECAVFREDCNGDLGTGGDGCETNLVNLQTCGACDNPCPDHPSIDSTSRRCNTIFRCVWECEDGFIDLDGDPSNFCEVEIPVNTAITNGLAGDAGVDFAVYGTPSANELSSVDGTSTADVHDLNAGTSTPRAAIASTQAAEAGSMGGFVWNDSAWGLMLNNGFGHEETYCSAAGGCPAVGGGLAEYSGGSFVRAHLLLPDGNSGNADWITVVFSGQNGANCVDASNNAILDVCTNDSFAFDGRSTIFSAPNERVYALVGDATSQIGVRLYRLNATTFAAEQVAVGINLMGTTTDVQGERFLGVLPGIDGDPALVTATVTVQQSSINPPTMAQTTYRFHVYRIGINASGAPDDLTFETSWSSTVAAVAREDAVAFAGFDANRFALSYTLQGGNRALHFVELDGAGNAEPYIVGQSPVDASGGPWDDLEYHTGLGLLFAKEGSDIVAYDPSGFLP